MSNDEPEISMVFENEEELGEGRVENQFEVLLGEAKKFCRAVGLHENLILDVFKADSDWAFILKVDALLESAVKEIIKSALKLEIMGRIVGSDALADFIDGLPMNGKTSLLQLLKASGCPDDDSGFVEAVQRVRNAYAHNIRLADLQLVEVIKQRSDKSHIIKGICNIKQYNEASLISSYEKDVGLLRFCMIDATMRILLYAYHIALKE